MELDSISPLLTDAVGGIDSFYTAIAAERVERPEAILWTVPNWRS